MVRPLAMVGASEVFFSPIPLAIGLFVSVSLLVALCAKHAKNAPTKYASKTRDPDTAKAPMPSPKQLITTISQKAMGHAKKPPTGQEPKGNNRRQEDGLWQKAILMGERCQPPEFSGVIYYDYSGNRIPEMPRSPKIEPMSPARTFNIPIPIPMHKRENMAY